MRIQELPPLFRNPDLRPPPPGSEQPKPATDPKSTSTDGDALDVTLSARITDISKEIVESLSDTGTSREIGQIEEIEARIRAGSYLQYPALEALADRLVDFYGR